MKHEKAEIEKQRDETVVAIANANRALKES